jgi:hypothetical protein
LLEFHLVDLRIRPPPRRRADSLQSAAPGCVFSGTITGRSAGPRFIVVTGALTRGSDTCQFSLTGEGTQIDGVVRIIQRHDCPRPLQGANTLSLAPHSAPSFTISARLPMAPPVVFSADRSERRGQAVRSDAAGHYQLTAWRPAR